MQLTENQLHILQHSLGCDKYGESPHLGEDEGDGLFGYYRNRYVCEPFPAIEELVTLGLMQPRTNVLGSNWYSVTAEGVKVMKEQSLLKLQAYRKSAKGAKAKADYSHYLANRDFYKDFTDYLRSKKHK